VKLTPAVRVIAVLSLVLMLVGVVLLGRAAATPWHTDSHAYFGELASLRARLYMREPSMTDFKAATAAFLALQNKYATHKWLYADMAYASLSLGLFMAVVTGLVARFGERLLRTQRNAWAVVGVTLLALAATLAGLWADPWHRFYREQLPEWSDTLAIPLAGAVIAMIPISLVTALLVFTPLIFRRGVKGPLLVVSRPPHWPATVANLLYALPLAFAVFLLTSFASRGGWALVPAGLLLSWLFLNARALWIAPKEDAA
jgi:hypothetical protein